MSSTEDFNRLLADHKAALSRSLVHDRKFGLAGGRAVSECPRAKKASMYIAYGKFLLLSDRERGAVMAAIDFFLTEGSK